MAVTEGKIRVTADTSDAQRALGDLGKALKGLESSSAGVGRAFKAVAAAISVGAIAGAVKGALDAAGELFDMANTLGMSVPALQTFQKAAGLVGVSAEQLNMSLMKMNANIGDALIKGTGPAVQAFERLGINLQQINGMKPEKQFELIAKRLSEIPNHAERSALAMDMFGKQGPKILAMAEDLDKVKQKMESMGLIISPEQQAALDLAGDKLDGLAGTVSTAWKKAVAAIAPYIIAVVDAIDKAIERAGGLDVILAKVGATIKFAMNVLLIMGMVKAIQLMVVGIKNAQTAFILFNSIVKRSPLFLLVGAAAALATYFGVDIVGGLDKMLGISEGVAGANDQIADKAQKIKEENEKATNAIKGFNEEQKKALKAFDESVAKIQLQTQYLRDVVNLGEDEANINKLINEEKEKLKKVGLEITDAQVETLRAAQKELNVATALSEEKKKQRALVEEYYNATQKSSDTLLQEIRNYGVLKKAMEDAYKQAGRPMEDPLGGVSFNKERDGDYEAFRRSEVNKTAVAAQEAARRVYVEINTIEQKYNEVKRLDAEYTKAVEIMDNQLLALKQAGFTEEIDAYKILNEAKLAMEKEYQQKILQAQVDRISQALNAERNAVAQSLSTADQATLQKAGQEEKQKQITADRIAFEKKSDMEKYAFGIDQAAQMFTALGAQNKKAFEAAKAFNIANAIMNTYMAATKALATYPPPFNFIAMAAAIGMGMAQVSAIRSQQYSGRALGGPVMGGQSYIVGENGPELFTPQGTGSITRNQDLQGGSSVNVNFTINAVDTAGVDELLISRKGVIQQIISDAMMEKGQRGL